MHFIQYKLHDFQPLPVALPTHHEQVKCMCARECRKNIIWWTSLGKSMGFYITPSLLALDWIRQQIFTIGTHFVEDQVPSKGGHFPCNPTLVLRVSAGNPFHSCGIAIGNPWMWRRWMRYSKLFRWIISKGGKILTQFWRKSRVKNRNETLGYKW